MIGDPVNVAARLQARRRAGHRDRRRDHPPPDPRRRSSTSSSSRSSSRASPSRCRPGRRSEPWSGVAPRAARATTPLIGRERRVGAAAARCSTGSSARSRPHLVTVIGQAGVGKIAPAARADARDRRADPHRPPMRVGQLPGLRRRARLLGARRDRPRTSSRSSTPTIPRSPGASCSGGIEELLRRDAEIDEPPERLAATIAPAARHRAGAGRGGRALRGEDPQQMRERLFSAVRLVVEAGSRRQPLVFADRGHPLGRRGDARPDRVPGALGARPGADRLPGARRAARPPAGLGRRPAQRDDDRARARSTASHARSWSRRCSAKRGAKRRPGRPRSRSARAATPCSPRRWSTASSRRAPPTPRRCRRRCTPCSPPGSTRSPGTSARPCSTPRWSARRSGRARSPRRATTARSSARRLARCGARTWSCPPPAAGWPASASTPSSTC